MDNRRITFPSIDEYIDSFPEHIKKKLKEMREIIKKEAPQAQEKFSYQMPTFYLNGNLVHFAGFSKHIGFYPGSEGIEAFEKEISKYKYGRGSVQFPLNEPLPVDLIRRIVRYRVEQNLNKPKRK